MGFKSAFKELILSSDLRLSLPSGLVASGQKSCMHLSPIHATCAAHSILDLITGIISAEE
jgi:hypothetical protein